MPKQSISWALLDGCLRLLSRSLRHVVVVSWKPWDRPSTQTALWFGSRTGGVQASEQWRSRADVGRASTRVLIRCGVLMRLVEWTVEDGRHHEDNDDDLHRCTE